MRPIDGDELLKKLKDKYYNTHPYTAKLAGILDCMELVREAPTIDLEARRETWETQDL